MDGADLTSVDTLKLLATLLAPPSASRGCWGRNRNGGKARLTTVAKATEAAARLKIAGGEARGEATRDTRGDGARAMGAGWLREGRLPAGKSAGRLSTGGRLSGRGGILAITELEENLSIGTDILGLWDAYPRQVPGYGIGSQGKGSNQAEDNVELHDEPCWMK